MQITISYLNSSLLEEQVKNSFKLANLNSEYVRAMQVRSIALNLAQYYGLDKKQVSAAALLHNISRLIPTQQYLELAEEYGIEILPEEKQNPQLLHQKISRILAVERFNISDKDVLNAITCHTTLRKSATLLDKIIFIASKHIEQKLQRLAFYGNNIPKAEKELNSAIYCYLFNLLNNKSQIHIVHPWAKDALQELQPDNS